ncbi:MAG: hypothetical protein IT305_24505 [Chloroflexi bacterium]|nr:hypothetical protein [Chloroflexota bacterium]
MAEMDAAVQAGDVEELRRVVQSLKSNAVDFGAAVVLSSCRDLRLQARDKSVDGPEARIVAIRKAWGCAGGALEVMRAEP